MLFKEFCSIYGLANEYDTKVNGFDAFYSVNNDFIIGVRHIEITRMKLSTDGGTTPSSWGKETLINAINSLPMSEKAKWNIEKDVPRFMDFIFKSN